MLWLFSFLLIGNKNMLDNTHPVSFQWSTPSEILQGFQAQDLWIAPPQFYELSRMCRFPFLLDLHKFSSKRATEGCEHWLPVHSNDEHNRPVSLLPGIKCLSHQFSSCRVLLKHVILNGTVRQTENLCISGMQWDCVFLKCLIAVVH